jgi:hypothetical protein
MIMRKRRKGRRRRRRKRRNMRRMTRRKEGKGGGGGEVRGKGERPHRAAYKIAQLDMKFLILYENPSFNAALTAA